MRAGDVRETEESETVGIGGGLALEPAVTEECAAASMGRGRPLGKNNKNSHWARLCARSARSRGPARAAPDRGLAAEIGTPGLAMPQA